MAHKSEVRFWCSMPIGQFQYVIQLLQWILECFIFPVSFLTFQPGTTPTAVHLKALAVYNLNLCFLLWMTVWTFITRNTCTSKWITKIVIKGEEIHLKWCNYPLRLHIWYNDIQPEIVIALLFIIFLVLVTEMKNME